MKIKLMIFPKKILVWVKWTDLGPKMTHPHKSGSTQRIFLKFCMLKGEDR